MTAQTSNRPHWLTPAVAAGLALAVFMAFFGVWRNGFVDYDDNSYVFLNHHIRAGLSWDTVCWAFTYVDLAHWVPLTWLSYALDYELYGLNPAGFHITNLFLHTTNVVLLFFTLRLMTGSLGRSALVAILFGVHPLRVESVAWVAERKDVLSGCFFMLTLFAYAKYALGRREAEGRSPEVRGSSSALPTTRPLFELPCSPAYLLSLACFALGLMSKSVLVTAPFVLLLLDYWPLNRFSISKDASPDTQDRQTDEMPGDRGWKAPKSPRSILQQALPLVTEKWPFFALALISCLVTCLAHPSGAMGNMMPLQNRLANIALSFVAYLQQTLWPANMAVFYPPKAVSLFGLWPVLAFILILAITVWALLLAQRRPFGLVGWCWFLGMLVPVSGIVQTGEMIQADRYTYLPSIGLMILAVWTCAALSAQEPRWRIARYAAVIVVVVALGVVTQRQVAVWRNTRTLFSHAARVTSGNYQALTGIASQDLADGQIALAISRLEEVLVIAPNYPRAEYQLGAALQMQGRMQEAIPHLLAAVGAEAELAGKARLVVSLLDAGRLTEAEIILNQVVTAMPRDPGGALMRAILLNEQGQTAEAAQLFRLVAANGLPFAPDNPRLNFEVAELYGLVGENQKAVEFYTRAIEVSPNFVNALNNCAWILATDPDGRIRNGSRAAELAERACELTQWKLPLFMGTLAAAYAEAGRFEDAAKMGERARDRARAENLEDVAKRNEGLLELYRAHRPFHEEK